VVQGLSVQAREAPPGPRWKRSSPARWPPGTRSRPRRHRADVRHRIAWVTALVEGPVTGPPESGGSDRLPPLGRRRARTPRWLPDAGVGSPQDRLKRRIDRGPKIAMRATVQSRV
jgi:hypothetical protein